MLEVGFEPTSANTADFKSAPLDQAPAFKLEQAVLLYFLNRKQGQGIDPFTYIHIYNLYIEIIIDLYKF